MSGLCESIFARALGLPTLFFLVITNRAAGLSKKRPLAHEDVLRRAEAAQGKLSRLLEALLPHLLNA
jgi:purine nucleoside phosphorylase